MEEFKSIQYLDQTSTWLSVYICIRARVCARARVCVCVCVCGWVCVCVRARAYAHVHVCIFCSIYCFPRLVGEGTQTGFRRVVRGTAYGSPLTPRRESEEARGTP